MLLSILLLLLPLLLLGRVGAQCTGFPNSCPPYSLLCCLENCPDFAATNSDCVDACDSPGCFCSLEIEESGCFISTGGFPITTVGTRFSCERTGETCEDQTTEEDCEEHGCEWTGAAPVPVTAPIPTTPVSSPIDQTPEETVLRKCNDVFATTSNGLREVEVDECEGTCFTYTYLNTPEIRRWSGGCWDGFAAPCEFFRDDIDGVLREDYDCTECAEDFCNPIPEEFTSSSTLFPPDKHPSDPPFVSTPGPTDPTPVALPPTSSPVDSIPDPTNNPATSLRTEAPVGSTPVPATSPIPSGGSNCDLVKVTTVAERPIEVSSPCMETDVVDRVSVTTFPLDGILNIMANGSVTYSPNTGFVGQDRFEIESCNDTTDQCVMTPFEVRVLTEGNNMTSSAVEASLWFVSGLMIFLYSCP